MLTPRDIHEAEFKRVWKGYNPDEVDEFLRRVVVEYEALYRENERLRKRIEELEATVEEYSRSETQIDETLALAKETAASLKEAASKEAEAVVTQARLAAEQILSEAKRQVESERALSRRLRQEAAHYRTRFEQSVRDFLARLDQLGLSVDVDAHESETPLDSAPAQVAAGLEDDLELDD